MIRFAEFWINQSLIVISRITGCISIFPFASVVCVTIGITSSMIGLKTFVITTVIKKYKSISKKNEKEAWQNNIVSKSKFHGSLNF